MTRAPTHPASGLLVGVLILMGAGWGLGQPLTKVAVSTGLPTLGLLAWQLMIGAAVLCTFILVRGGCIPLAPRNLFFYGWIACVGTLFPNYASYEAARVLPAGIISILLSTVPMIAFPVALGLGLGRFEPRRLLGLVFGLAGVLLITLPDASLPERAMLAFVPLALIAPLFYGAEGNLVARFGTGGVDAVTVIAGASLVGAGVVAPLAAATGQWVTPALTLPHGALALSALLHTVVYVAYVWMVGRAGSVFAAQVSYLVTGFGVMWAMLILGERFAPTVWLAMVVMFAGLAMVQPRPKLLAPKEIRT